MSEKMIEAGIVKNNVVEIKPENGKRGMQISGTFTGAIKLKVSVDNGKTFTPDLDADEEEIKFTKPQYVPLLADRHYWISVDLTECTDFSGLTVEVE